MLAFEVHEHHLEMVYVPKGVYTLATSALFTDNFIAHINSQVYKLIATERPANKSQAKKQWIYKQCTKIKNGMTKRPQRKMKIFGSLKDMCR